MNTWEIVWYWVEDGCICGKVVFSADFVDALDISNYLITLSEEIDKEKGK